MEFKEKISNLYRKIAKKTNAIPEKGKKTLFFSSLILAQILVFPAGAFAPQTKIEEAAQYMSEISTEKTIDGQYSYILVESEEGNDSFPNTIYNEYYFWYSVFRNSKNNFMATVNGNKQNDIYFQDILLGKQLTFIYSNVFSNKEYEDYYKHEFYDFNLMFSGYHSFGGNYSFCYLTQNQADELILSKGKEIKSEEYESLIGTSVTIVIEEVVYQWSIANIILETSDLFSACKDIFGDFLITHQKHPDVLKKERCYIFNEYDFQNRYKINYLKDNYDAEAYNYILGKNNLKENEIIDENMLMNVLITKYDTLNIWSIFFLLVSILLFLASCFFLFTCDYIKNLKMIIFSISGQLLLYLLIYVLFIVFNNVYIFSYFSLIFFTIFLLIHLLLIVIFNIGSFLKPFGNLKFYEKKNRNTN